MNTHKTDLTVEEAQELMLKGVKVTHRNFSQDEWATCLRGRQILTEEGYTHSWFNFWGNEECPHDRINWKNGWGRWEPEEGEKEPTNKDVYEGIRKGNKNTSMNLPDWFIGTYL